MNPWYDPSVLKEKGSYSFDLLQNFIPKDHHFSPGDFLKSLPEDPPQEGTPLEEVISHTIKELLPGATINNSPYNFQMTGSINETTVQAEIFSNAFHTPGFAWEASPCQTELENIVMDWFAEAMDLPEKFLIKNEGGGVLSTSTTTSYFHSINVAKFKKLEALNIDFTDEKTLKFVAYYPEVNEIKARKALKLKEIVHYRKIPLIFDPINENYEISIKELEETIVKDIQNGLIPFWCDSSFGSEAIVNLDNLLEISKLCKKYEISWNINATWGGIFLILPEFKGKFTEVMQNADSILINGRYLSTGGYSNFLYFANKMEFRKSIGGLMGCPIVDLKLQDRNVMHLKDFSIGFGKRFNNFKLYLHIRKEGLTGLQEILSNRVKKAQILQEKLKALGDKYIEIRQKNVFASICFSVKGLNNEEVFNKINEDQTTGVIEKHMVNGECLLKVCINNEETKIEHIESLFSKIERIASKKL